MLHIIPLATTIAILCLNIFGVYWQDLGHPNQKNVLQALQYAAKAHEVMMIASLMALIIHRLQGDLSSLKGAPFGLLVGAFKLQDPLYLFTKQFWGGAAAGVRLDGLSRLLPLGCLLILGSFLTLVLGPSSAVAMIPRLDW